MFLPILICLFLILFKTGQKSLFWSMVRRERRRARRHIQRGRKRRLLTSCLLGHLAIGDWLFVGREGAGDNPTLAFWCIRCGAELAIPASAGEFPEECSKGLGGCGRPTKGEEATVLINLTKHERGKIEDYYLTVLPFLRTKDGEDRAVGDVLEDLQLGGENPSRAKFTEGYIRELIQEFDAVVQEVHADLFHGDEPDRAAFVQMLMGKHTFRSPKDTGEVYYYDGGVYRQACAGSVVAEEIEAEFRSRGRTATKYFVNETRDAIARRCYVDRTVFNPRGKICLLNGILDLETGTFSAHDPDLLFTRQLAVNYDQSATCPEFLRFIQEIQPTPERRETAQEMCGYVLEPGYPIHSIIVWWGGGNNGKGCLLRILERILGEGNYSGSSMQDLVGNRFAKAELWGKMSNICADLPRYPIKEDGILKMLTGQDSIEAERKFSQRFKFYNEAKLYFAANELPPVEDQTFGFWRRINLLDFPVTIEPEKVILNLDEKLFDAESSGILNWLLEGRKRLMERGRFQDMGTAGERMNEWRRRSDSLKAFVEDNIKVDPSSFILKADFQNVYADYCLENGLSAKSDSQVGKDLPRLVSSAMSARKGGVKGKDQKPAWVGIAFMGSSEGSEGSEVTLPNHGMRTRDTIIEMYSPSTFTTPTTPPCKGLAEGGCGEPQTHSNGEHNDQDPFVEECLRLVDNLRLQDKRLPPGLALSKAKIIMMQERHLLSLGQVAVCRTRLGLPPPEQEDCP